MQKYRNLQKMGNLDKEKAKLVGSINIGKVEKFH